MSNIEPTKPYVYQPEPLFKNGVRVEKIYGIAGPGTRSLEKFRYATREEAEKAIASLLDQAENNYGM